MHAGKRSSSQPDHLQKSRRTLSWPRSRRSALLIAILLVWPGAWTLIGMGARPAIPYGNATIRILTTSPAVPLNVLFIWWGNGDMGISAYVPAPTGQVERFLLVLDEGDLWDTSRSAHNSPITTLSDGRLSVSLSIEANSTNTFALVPRSNLARKAGWVHSAVTFPRVTEGEWICNDPYVKVCPQTVIYNGMEYSRESHINVSYQLVDVSGRYQVDSSNMPTGLTYLLTWGGAVTPSTDTQGSDAGGFGSVGYPYVALTDLSRTTWEQFGLIAAGLCLSATISLLAYATRPRPAESALVLETKE
jgi:hypothetical protein